LNFLESRPFIENVKVGKRISRAVADGIARQQMATPASAPTRIRVGSNGTRRVVEIDLPLEPPSLPSTEEGAGNVLAPMARRKQVQVGPTDAPSLLPTPTIDHVEVSAFKVLGRLHVWLGSINAFVLGTAWDVIRRRDSEDRRAIRLRQIFENAGGTLVKIGQQMSIRLDMLPVRICEELSLMLDSVPPFPTEEAIAVIEQTTGRKLEEIFSAFDPEPIGSASIACVYQGVLRDTGEKVAVKVRRPGIRKLVSSGATDRRWPA
jgi:hypothetical protein